MIDFLYRFRSMEKLLGDNYKELEKQEIYFSTLQELNDPMEGFSDLIFQGDENCWDKFIKLYLLSLLNAKYVLNSLDKHKKLEKEDIFSLKIISQVEKHNEIYEEICNFFLMKR